MLDWLGLFAVTFLSATVLPFPSELVVVAMARANPHATAAVLLVATSGNTLGGLTTYAIGRLIPHRVHSTRALDWVRRWGAPALLLAWLPIIGDALCGVAGWLRLALLPCALLMLVGKAARYGVLLYVTG